MNSDFISDKTASDQLSALSAHEQQYLKQMQKVDYSSLRMETIFAYDLKRKSPGILMTRLRCSKSSGFKQYFGDGRVFDGSRDFIDVLLISVSDESLVVISCDDAETFPVKIIPLHDESATLTQFKRDDRAYKLLWHKRDAIGQIAWSSTLELLLWKHPYLLRAQTELDKDYRKEWCAGDIVYEGNNYGDTSDFFIIGVLKKGRIKHN